MRMTTGRIAASLALAVMAAPDLGLAQSQPRVLLEKSATFALDNQYRSFRVPTTDTSGRTKFFDVTVRLNVDAQGRITGAAVSSTPSPNIVTGVIQPGTYRAAGGETCRVRNVTLSNGRIQSYLNCAASDGDLFELSVATGRAVAGHPFFPALQRAGVDKLADADTYTFGAGTNGAFDVDRCSFTTAGGVIGAKTDGSQLNLYVFFNDSEVNCAAAFTRQ